jgi:hypothetical protein
MFEYCLAAANLTSSLFVFRKDSVTRGTDMLCHVGTQVFLVYVDVTIMEMFCYVVLYKLISFFYQVYSVVNGIVSLELIKQNRPSDHQMNINQWLIDKGYAQQAEESYLSKVSALVE